MALKPPPRLADPGDSGSFTPNGSGDESGAAPGSAGPPVPGQTDPGAMDDMKNILQITIAARRLAGKYPSATPEVQTINDAVQKLQVKITAVQPPSEVAAPPQ